MPNHSIVYSPFLSASVSSSISFRSLSSLKVHVLEFSFTLGMKEPQLTWIATALKPCSLIVLKSSLNLAGSSSSQKYWWKAWGWKYMAPRMNTVSFPSISRSPSTRNTGWAVL